VKPEDERTFFGHDLATPLTNLAGAHFLLKAALRGDHPEAQEALEILEANIRTLERMLGWYWRLRELEGSLAAVPPWSADLLVSRLQALVKEEAIPLQAPERISCHGRLQIPPPPLEAGLIGAGLTLARASGGEVSWTFKSTEGVLLSHFRVSGDQDMLDPERLFRKVYWPSRQKFAAWLDPCLPYLRAVLDPFGGHLELVWEQGTWTLTAELPLLP
jgi:hypothetical protein